MAPLNGPDPMNGVVPTSRVQQRHKVVLLGETSVGKSSLVVRFVKSHFTEHIETTIGAAFYTQTICLGHETIKLELWDTAGQERYHSLAPMYYRGAQAAIIVYDVTNSRTFQRAKVWIRELQSHLPSGCRGVVIALVGNKADLPLIKRQVAIEEAAKYAEENGILFMETSAKTGMNVNDIFLAISKRLSKIHKTVGFNLPADDTIRPKKPKSKEKSKCC